MSDAREMLQFNALLEARAAASGMDLSSISEDTRERVAAMLRSRRERMMEEEREYLESLRQGEAEASFTKEIAATMTEDEKTARHVVLRQEEKAFERLVKVFDEQFQHLSAGMLTLRQQKEIEASRAKKLHALERELNKQRFLLYWDQHAKQRKDVVRSGGNDPSLLAAAGGASPGTPGSSSSTVDLKSPEAQMHRMTAVLRRAYVNSAPMFATDPEELWRRGQALPPTAAATATTPYGEVDLPPYHEFGARVREQYQKHVAKQGIGAAIGEPVKRSGPGSGILSSKPPSSAKYPLQQDSPFGTAVAENLAAYLS